MNKNVVLSITGLSLMVIIGVFFANDDTTLDDLLAQEREWLDAPSEAQRYSLWKLKNDEVHAQCSVETIEQTITRLQEQLKKDRERLETKIEPEKHAQS